MISAARCVVLPWKEEKPTNKKARGIIILIFLASIICWLLYSWITHQMDIGTLLGRRHN